MPNKYPFIFRVYPREVIDPSEIARKTINSFQDLSEMVRDKLLGLPFVEQVNVHNNKLSVTKNGIPPKSLCVLIGPESEDPEEINQIAKILLEEVPLSVGTCGEILHEGETRHISWSWEEQENGKD
jgi:hypothetical protein